ncbi:Insulin-like growth factor 2 mRNA-binding protein 3 [Perkinsus olseni]|uniref:Insulin-like growth factor 2 mRNA-binding protein 3 n=1 Tax=Perkinsus olseni TaxID=32597 RepID=A0A7J6RCG6_PEROL|nr:Insulin-like growth factor 2 mRNA-binding protein 3 [Perkinsus olseni]
MDYGVTSEDVDYDETAAAAAASAQQHQSGTGVASTTNASTTFQPPPDDRVDDEDSLGDDDDREDEEGYSAEEHHADEHEDPSPRSGHGNEPPAEQPASREEPASERRSSSKRRRNSGDQSTGPVRRWTGANRVGQAQPQQQQPGRDYLPCRCLVPDDIAGHIIGVRGTGLHRLQKLSGANVHVSKPSETPKSLVDPVVTFIGNPQQVDTAVAKLLDMLRRDKPQSRGIFVTSFAFLDGRGQRLRALESDFHCEVTIAKAPIEGMMVRPVIIKGSDEATAAVISKLRNTVEEVVRSKRIPFEEASALVMGSDRQGDRSAPPPPPPPPPGPPVEIESRPGEVVVPWVPGLEKIPRDQDSGSPVMLVVDRRYSAFVIGKNGKSITEIEHCSGARIQFEKADQFPPNPKLAPNRNEVMVLRGTMAEKSRGMVKTMEVLDVKEDKYTELLIQASKTRNVIGRGGDTINWICKTTGCNVQVQKSESSDMPTRFVTFEGSLDKRVKAALMVLVAIELSFMPATPSSPEEGAGRGQEEVGRRDQHPGDRDREYSPESKRARHHHHHQQEYQSHGRSTESPRGHRGSHSYEGVSESSSAFRQRGSLDNAAVALGTAADRLGNGGRRAALDLSLYSSDIDHDEASYFSVVVGRNTINSWVKAGFLDELSRRSGAHVEIGKDAVFGYQRYFSTTAKKDPYSIMGVSPAATQKEIKEKFRELAKKYHPDRNPDDPGAQSRMASLTDAYAILTDPKKRAIFDREQREMRNGSTGSGTTGSGASASTAGDWHHDPSQMFSEFSKVVLGNPRHVVCHVFGRQAKYRQAGQVSQRGDDITTEIEVLVSVPAGARQFTELRLPGLGHCGLRGGRSGDLFITIKVKEHERFRRVDEDVHLTVPVTLSQALLGGTVEIPSLTSEKDIIKLQIPPNTLPGNSRIIRGKGPPKLSAGSSVDSASNPRGNLVLHFSLSLPERLTPRQEALIREFDDIERESTQRREFKHGNNEDQGATRTASATAM